MLSKRDLELIGQVIDERVGIAIDEHVPRIVDARVPRIIDARVPRIIENKLKPIRKDLSVLKKTLDTAINMFNRDDIKLEKRVKAIEDHLDLPSKN